MKKYIISTLYILALLLTACSDERIDDELLSKGDLELVSKTQELGVNPLYKLAKPGVFYVKMDSETAKQLSTSGTMDIQLFSSISSDIEVAAKHIGVKSVEKVFPYSKKYEKRHRRYGLDRWYIVSYEETHDVSEAIRTFSAIRKFEIVEPVYDIDIDENQIQLSALPTHNVSGNSKAFFNDPRLPEQWHYNNDGTAPGAVYGADINLFKAWEKETGKPNVIIAVIDDGVDYNHEDLKESMWINKNTDVPVEREGMYGNYIEEKHGGNFVPSGVIGGHGTHVAGTIAARNNNNIGVCGIAGGDGTPESGVRLMACLAIDSRPKEQRKGSYPEKAFVFAADNGAVIAQNSWGFPPNVPMSQVIKDAIDYFIDNAGVDNEGKQLPDSPMKGGVVIFAAGNDNEDAPCYPAAYERVIAVSAMSTNFTRSSFTNRGEWVDIMAPGGDQNRYGNRAGVLSCVPNNAYGYYQGTSMACPHVSGVAGLIISKNGGEGYTNTELKKAILSALRSEDIDAKNLREAGRLGRGYIDASLAFDIDSKIAPDAPTKGSDVEVGYSSLTVSWSVNKDDDDILPTFQDLYISREPITVDNIGTLAPTRVRVSVSKPAEEMYYTFKNLTHSTKYYVAVVSEDRWGNRSEPGKFEYTTRLNQNPVVNFTNSIEKIIVTRNKMYSVNFETSDPDGHIVKCFLEGDTAGVSFQYDGGKGVIQIRSVLQEGEYTFNLVAKDEFNAITKIPVKFNIINPRPLKIKGEFSQLVLGFNQKEFVLPLKENIDYNPQVDIKFEASASDGSVVITSLSKDGNLSIIPLKKGSATIYIKAEDETGEKIETSFKVRVVEDSESPVHIIYPIPVKTTLNLMLNKSIKNARIKVVKMNGKVVIEEVIAEVKSKDGVVSLNVANLAPNTYRLIVESSNMPRYERVFMK